jgi:thiamine pyrophosphate-dependent acetolactate synthase large subunit-like protein
LCVSLATAVFIITSANWKRRAVTISTLNQEIRLNDIAYGGKQRGRAEEMWRFPEVNFAKVAESFGCVGIRVEKPTDLADALRRAIAMNKPVVVDVVADMYAIAPHPWTSTGRDFHSYQKTGA